MSDSVSIPDALRIDGESAARELEEWICERTATVLRQKGAVVGLSGGIDSTVVAALCARALGAENVLGVMMSERESASETLELSRLAAAVPTSAIARRSTPTLPGTTKSVEGLAHYPSSRESRDLATRLVDVQIRSPRPFAQAGTLIRLGRGVA